MVNTYIYMVGGIRLAKEAFIIGPRMTFNGSCYIVYIAYVMIVCLAMFLFFWLSTDDKTNEARKNICNA